MNQNKKISSLKLNIVKNLNLYDILLLFAIIGFSAALGFANKLNTWVQVVIFAVSFLSLIWLIIPSKKHNCRLYTLIVRIFKYKSSTKKYKKNTPNDTKLLVPFKRIIESKYVETLSSAGTSMFTVFKFNGFNIYSNNRDDKYAFFNQLINVFNSIETKFTFVKKPASMNIEDNLKYNVDKYFESKMLQSNELVQNHFIYNTHDFEQLKKIENIDIYYLVIYGKNINEIKQLENEFIKSFENTKIPLSNVTGYELLDFTNMIYNVSLSQKQKQNFFDETLDEEQTMILDAKMKGKELSDKELKKLRKDKEYKLMNLLAPETIEFGSKHITINKGENEKYLSFQTLYDFSSLKINEGWACDLFSSESLIVWNLKPINEATKQKILDKAMQLNNANADTKSNFKIQKIRVEQEVLDELVNFINVQKMNLFDSNLIFVNQSKDLKTLHEIEVRNGINAKKAFANVYLNHYLQKEALQNSIFIKEDFLRNGIEMSSRNIVHGWPWVSNSLNDGNNFLLGFTANSYSPIIFDLFKKTKDRTSFSMILWGVPGAGKSAATSKFALHQFVNGSEVIIIDPQREYKDLCHKLNGNWIEMGKGLETKINPLQVNFESEKDNVAVTNNMLITNHIKKTKEFFSLLYPDLDEKDLRVVTFTLSEFYAKQKFKPIEKMKNNEFPTMIDYVNFLGKYKFSDKKTELYYKDSINKLFIIFNQDFLNNGIFSALYTGHTNIDFDNSFTVIDTYNLINNISSNEGQASLFLILSHVRNRISNNFFINKTKKICLIVDEAHRFINAKNMSSLEFLFDTVKTIRKYNGSVILTTQNPSDFELSEDVMNLTKGMVENIQYTLILRQNQNGVNAISQMYKSKNELTYWEKNFLSSAPIGCGMFSIDNKTRFQISLHYNAIEKEIIFKSGDLSNI
ncbi:Mbov_0397 family ICE element conjugal transfer ATPase [Mycoplasmopsis fermentans]|uniref:Mbov_0397 family ICE element conjugal transfer ATPase n=1 Tax=Mycoplasmopsis fermentans TaxID=2115 RepID=UPI0001E32E98|nr:trsE [Mycoplasmopsis fermentans]ADN69079.1 predicted trsE-like protein [Mycoplasmopsis fermentans JER]